MNMKKHSFSELKLQHTFRDYSTCDIKVTLQTRLYEPFDGNWLTVKIKLEAEFHSDESILQNKGSAE